MNEIVFEIKEHVGTLNAFPSGWAKEVNIVKWNDSEPKIDIRDWNIAHTHMTRGITLREDEAKKLASLLLDRF